MFKLAIIGCGTHSEIGHAVPLARYAAAHPGELELAACCDLEEVRTELFREKYGFLRGYRDAGEMLDAEEPQACIAVLPVRLVAGMAERLFRRGLPCTVEKPPGATLAEVRRLVDLAAETGARHMVSVNRRFAPLLNRAVSWAREQGEMRYVRAAMIRKKRVEPSFVWSTALHGVDALRHIAGDVQSASISVQEDPLLAARWYQEDYEFTGGARGRLDIITTAGMQEESYDIFGENFRAHAVFPITNGFFGPGSTLRCWRDNQLVIDEAAPADEPRDVTAGPYAEVEALAAALRGERSWGPTVADVLPSAELVFDFARRAGVLDKSD